MKSKNAVLKLEKEFHENNNSHVFLLETNALQSCLTTVKELCKSILTNDETTNRQIEEETYLELIIIRPDGKEIKKDQILSLQERLKTKPILSDNLIYIILPAEAMSAISANKLLKTIEEPNPNTIGFLITTNSDLLLPTIKSRCETLTLIYDQETELEEFNEEALNLAKLLVEAIEEKDHIKFSEAKSNDKIIKENSKTIENLIKDYYNTACNLSKNRHLDQALLDKIVQKNSFQTRLQKAKYVNKTLTKLINNMNEDLLLEKLFIELKDVR